MFYETDPRPYCVQLTIMCTHKSLNSLAYYITPFITNIKLIIGLIHRTILVSLAFKD
jgi:hypothetical protein